MRGKVHRWGIGLDVVHSQRKELGAAREIVCGSRKGLTDEEMQAFDRVEIVSGKQYLLKTRSNDASTLHIPGAISSVHSLTID